LKHHHLSIPRSHTHFCLLFYLFSFTSLSSSYLLFVVFICLFYSWLMIVVYVFIIILYIFYLPAFTKHIFCRWLMLFFIKIIFTFSLPLCCCICIGVSSTYILIYLLSSLSSPAHSPLFIYYFFIGSSFRFSFILLSSSSSSIFYLFFIYFLLFLNWCGHVYSLDM
jgi:hypothetical protein